LTLSIQVPDGFHIRSTSPGFQISDRVATMATAFNEDLEFQIDYESKDTAGG
jgi:hypothetical protein